MFTNLNNCHSYEIKKDMKLEITENKKGIFSTQKKITIRALSVEDLEAWVIHIKKILMEKKL